MRTRASGFTPVARRTLRCALYQPLLFTATAGLDASVCYLQSRDQICSFDRHKRWSSLTRVSRRMHVDHHKSDKSGIRSWLSFGGVSDQKTGLTTWSGHWCLIVSCCPAMALLCLCLAIVCCHQRFAKHPMMQRNSRCASYPRINPKIGPRISID